MHTFLFYVRILIKLFRILERYIRPRILVLIRKIICARRSYVRLVNQIFGISTGELYSESHQILKYLHFVFKVGLYYLILVSYYTVLHHRISIICFFSHVVFNLCPVYTVFLHYCYLHYLFLAIQ